MKKIILFFALLIFVNAKASQPQYTVLEHPTSEDSLRVVQTVDGVTSVVSIFIGNKPVVNSIINSKEFTGGVVALILAIWRFFEKRRLRRKGLLKDRYYRSNGVDKGISEGQTHYEHFDDAVGLSGSPSPSNIIRINEHDPSPFIPTVETWQNSDLYKLYLTNSGIQQAINTALAIYGVLPKTVEPYHKTVSLWANEGDITIEQFNASMLALDGTGKVNKMFIGKSQLRIWNTFSNLGVLLLNRFPKINDIPDPVVNPILENSLTSAGIATNPNTFERDLLPIASIATNKISLFYTGVEVIEPNTFNGGVFLDGYLLTF